MFGLSPFELTVIGVIAVVLFGDNLPDVAKKFGTTYAQLRKNLNDVQSQFREAQREASKAMDLDNPSSTKPSSSLTYQDEPEDTPEPSAPKFTPPK